MSGALCLRNRQRTRPVDVRFLRQVVTRLLSTNLALADFDLTVHLVDAIEMERVNQHYLQHSGSTDVITLDYKASSNSITGELFICVDEALLQARRFHTRWQEEVIRYLVHGVLHLQGYDDLKSEPRRMMKREEEKRLQELGDDFHLSKLQRKPKVSA